MNRNAPSRQIGSDLSLKRWWMAFLATMIFSTIASNVIGAEKVQKLGENLWLVDSGDDTLVAHAVLTAPPYHADPSGKKDSTPAFQKAIAAVGEMGGGLIYVPAGQYRIYGNIDLHPHKVVIHGAFSKKERVSTVLLAYQGKGKEEGKPFITIRGKSCGLKNLGIYYPDQGRKGFTPYPFTIASGPAVLLENLSLYNSYQGISFAHNNGVIADNIRMCALKKGLVAKYSSEFGWTRDIVVSAKVWDELPSFIKFKKPREEQIRTFMGENCVGVEFGALDGFVLDGLAAKDCKTALLVAKDIQYFRTANNGAEAIRVKDNYGFGAILSRIEGKIEYLDHDFYYWGIPASNLDHVKGLPKLRKEWPLHRRATKRSPDDFFNVKTFGAKGDGQTDDTKAIQQALKRAAQNGGGIVYLPQGQYRITEPLSVPTGTELRGACARQELRLIDTEVTSLLFETGANPSNPAKAPACISLSKRAGLRGLNVLFPAQWEQLSERGFEPIPWACAVRGKGPEVYLIDCVITPSWQMIDFASYPCDNFMIKRVSGWGMKTGFDIGGGTRKGTIEFTQMTYGQALGTDRNPLVKFEGGWHKATKILSVYSGSNSLSYAFGNASQLDCYGLQAFRPFRHIETYQQKGQSLRDSRFFYPVLDVALEHSLVMDKAKNLDFYGYWVTGKNPRDSHWIKGRNNQNIRVFAPSVQPTYHRGNYEKYIPLNEFTIIPEKVLDEKVRVINGGPHANNLLDGNLRTSWEAPLPKAEVVLDLGRVQTVHRFTVVDGHIFNVDQQTAIKDYELTSSLDGKNWKPMEIPQTTFHGWGFKNPQKFVVLDYPLEPTPARYVKLKIISTYESEMKKPEDCRVVLRQFDLHCD